MANMIQNATSKQVSTADNAGRATMQAYIQQMAPAIKAALPSVMTPERFTRIVLSALSSNPKLASCTPQSFLGAMMTAAQLGMEPNTPLGQAYLIPFNNKGRLECEFQLGYKGLIDLAYRSGEVSTIQAHVVYENDEFEYAYGLEPQLKHVPAQADRGEPVSVYAVFRTKDGGFGFSVMSMEDVRNHAEKYSKAYGTGYSPWKTNFEEMAKKTVLKKVLKYAPLKSDFVRSVVQDGTVKTDISKDMYEVPAVVVDDEAEELPEVDEDTGEVKEHA